VHARPAVDDGSTDDKPEIAVRQLRWRLHLGSPPAVIHDLLATPAGRAHFWAEDAPSVGDGISFRFANGMQLTARILVDELPRVFEIEYFGAVTRFTLDSDGDDGTDLTLTSDDQDPETAAGWVSVLLTLKAAADFGVDLRNHDPRRTWDQGFVDN
jgi:hypothetical protein